MFESNIKSPQDKASDRNPRHPDTQTLRHADTQTPRHSDTQTLRHSDTQTGVYVQQKLYLILYIIYSHGYMYTESECKQTNQTPQRVNEYCYYSYASMNLYNYNIIFII